MSRRHGNQNNGKLRHALFEQRLQQMAMAVLFFFGAMAEERHSLRFGELLQEAQSPLLAVVFDVAISIVKGPALPHLGSIAAAVIRPGYFAAEVCITKLLAWPEVRHPNMITVARQTASAPARGQNAEAILLRVDRGVH